MNRSICHYLINPSADVREPGYGGEQADEPVLILPPQLGRGQFTPIPLLAHLEAAVWSTGFRWGSGASLLGFEPWLCPSELTVPPWAGGFTSLGLSSSHCVGGLIAAPPSEVLVKIL